MRRVALQLYRLLVLVAIAWTIRSHHLRLRIEGDRPIQIEELRSIFPSASLLRSDPSSRAGLFVHDEFGKELGYVLRTSPVGDSILGYRGWTDSVIAFDPALKVLGVRIHASQDTREHVEDIQTDRSYLKTWNGKTWDQVARVTPEEAGIEGVSGATMTSMAMAEAIMRRLQSADSALRLPPPPIRWRSDDIGLALIVAAALALTFTGTHGRKWLRLGFQLLVIVYVGLLCGAPLAQSLFAGWSESGLPWRSAPGLVLIMAAALAVPWASGKPMYCQQICPHGAAQELLHRFAPKRWRLAVPKDFASGLRWLPALLLAMVIAISLLQLPIDLAHLEPFDAYSLRAAGFATLAIALLGLIASCFVPMAYCHYGCPTGALLNFVRSRGPQDRFSRRDFSALLLLALALVLSWKYYPIQAWMIAE